MMISVDRTIERFIEDRMAAERHTGRVEGVVFTACGAVTGGIVCHFLFVVLELFT